MPKFIIYWQGPARKIYLVIDQFSAQEDWTQTESKATRFSATEARTLVLTLDQQDIEKRHNIIQVEV